MAAVATVAAAGKKRRRLTFKQSADNNIVVPEEVVPPPPPQGPEEAVPEEVPLCYRDVDIINNAWKIKKTNCNVILIFRKHKELPPQIVLSHRDEPPEKFPFTLDFKPRRDTVAPPPGGLFATISLSAQQTNFLQSVDAWIQQQALINSREWFGGKVHSVDEIAEMYSPILKKNRDGRFPPKLKAKIVVVVGSAYQQRLTTIDYVKLHHPPIQGSGWDFVKSILGSSDWKGYGVRGVIEPRRIWVSAAGNRFGIDVSFVHLVVIENDPNAPHPPVSAPRLEFDFPELQTSSSS